MNVKKIFEKFWKMNNHEETMKVKTVIQNYTEGTFEADEEKLLKAFHPEAVMNGFLGPDMLIAKPELFISDMLKNPSMASQNDPYHAEIESIRIEGDIASVILSETGFKGSGCLVNHFHLIKDNQEWKIISKLFTTVG